MASTVTAPSFRAAVSNCASRSAASVCSMRQSKDVDNQLVVLARNRCEGWIGGLMSFAVEMGRVLLALGKEEDLGVTSSASVGSTTLAVMARVYDTHMVLRRSSARTLVVLGRSDWGILGYVLPLRGWRRIQSSSGTHEHCSPDPHPRRSPARTPHWRAHTHTPTRSAPRAACVRSLVGSK
jgi:hypothetical protein